MVGAVPRWPHTSACLLPYRARPGRAASPQRKTSDSPGCVLTGCRLVGALGSGAQPSWWLTSLETAPEGG